MRALALLVLLAGTLEAQLPDPFAPLSSPVMCRAEPLDSGRVRFFFVMASDNGPTRDITFVADTAGRSRMLIISNSATTADSLLAEAFVVEWGDSIVGQRGRWAESVTPGAAESAPADAPREPLTPAELRRAGEFAEHLWSRRCGRSSRRE